MKNIMMLILIGALSVISAQEKQYGLGEIVPYFTLQGIDGKTYSLQNELGKPIVIHFATTWCPFCNAEIPNLEKLYQEYENRGVRVFVIDIKEDGELVSRLSKKAGITFPVLLDKDGSVATRYAPAGVLPDLARDEVMIASNLVIDRDGKIQFFTLLNSTGFDAKLIELRKVLDAVVNRRSQG